MPTVPSHGGGSWLTDGVWSRIGDGLPYRSMDGLIVHGMAELGIRACLLAAVVLTIELVDLLRGRNARNGPG